MEETKKIFSQKSIALATYLGGPAAAGYLVKKNYEAFDQDDDGIKAFIISVVFTILIFAGIFSIPEHLLDKIPNALIPAVYTGIIALIVEKTQGTRIKEHKASGGEFFSVRKAAGIGGIFLVILVVVIAVTAFISGDLTRPDFDAKTYDYKVEKFLMNENKALAVFNEMENVGPNFLVREFNKGIVLWKENKEIVESMNSIENLPAELQETNKKLLKYCDLRISHYETIAKAISEGTDDYTSEIDGIGMEINKILKELNK